MNDPSQPPFSGKAMLGLFEEALETRKMPPPPSPPDFWESVEFPYQIELFAGRGSSGFVWKAHPRAGGPPVALKLIPFRGGSERIRYRWAIEVSALEKLRHPNLVCLIDHGLMPDGSAGWLALEWIEGQCLARILSDQGRITVASALDLTQQACAGLAAIHAAGLVHRDIKPANLLLEKPTSRLVVTDLGISLDLAENPDARLTRTLERAATPGYAPPEQFEPDYVPQPAGDQYTLAVTLWEMLTGTRPAGAFAKLHTLAKTPAALDVVLRRALDPLPAKRYPSIEAFASALRRATRWHAPFHKPLLICLLAAIPLGFAAGHFLKPSPLPPAVREVTFPMRIQSGDLPVADGRKGYMNIDVTLQRDGKFSGFIHTFSREPLTGFTGQAFLVFRDRDGNILTKRRSESIGVNGKWIPGRRPHRVDDWSDDIGPELGQRAFSVEAFARLADGIPALQRLNSSVEEFKDGLKNPDAYPTAPELRKLPDP